LMKIPYVREFIRNLEPKKFYRYLAIFFALFFVLIGVIGYSYYRRLSNVQRRLKRINQQREEARSILQEHRRVRQQQAEIDAILSKDKEFRIADYFLSVIKELNLTTRMTQEPVISEEDLNNGYVEVRLSASFTDMDMKQISQLLFRIEHNERVYPKEISIVKAMKSPTLDVTLVIATLRPKAAGA
jgi:hypothetical protein